MAKDYATYTTADREFSLVIANNLASPRDGIANVSIKLTRLIPDPTPGDAFNAYRPIRNAFGFSYSFDAQTRAETSVDVPRLRAALLSLVDTTLQGRLIGGEK